MSQITIRDLPEPLEREIRREARRRGLSLNKTIAAVLSEHLGFQPEVGQRRDLSTLAGTWDEAAWNEFRSATAAFETIDTELWKT
ncbi:MAG TPA: hypothetical protein VMW69_07815 [Spirochaetia bacterium]|nr:hypothetical protein [Spirochaetia bacterium]